MRLSGGDLYLARGFFDQEAWLYLRDVGGGGGVMENDKMNLKRIVNGRTVMYFLSEQHIYQKHVTYMLIVTCENAAQKLT